MSAGPSFGARASAHRPARRPAGAAAWRVAPLFDGIEHRNEAQG